MYNYNYDELYHHGIFGQKWGKKNGPPYPLKPGKHSAREKKRGWRRSLKNKTPEIKKDPTETISRVEEYKNHPDYKYMDSRNFGSDDLGRLSQRFNSEKSFNDALAAKLRSENMLNEEMLKNMNRKQKRELYDRMNELQFNTAYNRAIQQSIQSQIDLINSKKTLNQLTAAPPTKMQKFKKATGEIIADIGKNTVKNIGGQVATYYLGTAINKALGDNIVDTRKQNGGNGKKKGGNKK